MKLRKKITASKRPTAKRKVMAAKRSIHFLVTVTDTDEIIDVLEDQDEAIEVARKYTQKYGDSATVEKEWIGSDGDVYDSTVCFQTDGDFNSSTKIGASSAKRKVMAAALGEFYDSDFKRMMEQIVDDIVDEWDPADGGDPDDFIREQLDYEIERECTYYSDCINIIWASHTTDWSDADYEISSLGTLAEWIIEREFYDEGYYDDALERMTGGDEDEEEY